MVVTNEPRHHRRCGHRTVFPSDAPYAAALLSNLHRTHQLRETGQFSRTKVVTHVRPSVISGTTSNPRDVIYELRWPIGWLW